MPKDEKKLPKM